MRILLACDRSGGHVFPALSIAQVLKKTEEVCFFITSHNLKKYAAEEGFKVFGKSFMRRRLIIEILWRFFEAILILLIVRPKKIIGFGGRDSFFLVLFGSLVFCDTSIYEPNATFGKANKVLSFFVRKIIVGFDMAAKNKKTVIAGVPLRANIRILDKSQAKERLGLSGKPIIFCFGGSQGSSFLNEIFFKLITDLNGDFGLIHLTGQLEYSKLIEAYGKISKPKFIKEFYYNMEELYSAADLVICRAGALTLAEVNYYKVPAILMPIFLAGGHQKENAFYFKHRGAAEVFCQDEFSFSDFKNTATQLLFDNKKRQDLTDNLGKIKFARTPEEFCSDAGLL